MRFFKSLWLLFTTVFILPLSASAQNQQVYSEKYSLVFPLVELPFLTSRDSVRQTKIPQLKLPTQYQNQLLPERVDNSQLPYFRPVLTQTGFECSQTTGVAYSFTYEINRLRNLPSNVIENQYPTHFVFNWCNQGVGAACSFFDSWDIISAVGTPTISEYGGTADFGGEKRWMNGYDLYYSAMKNRLWEFYSISLKDEEGLLTLKHWLNDHLDGSETGGVASIYCSYSTLNDQLPPGTPEAGKYVIPELENPSNHAVCIVGYHDSIRWDYNNDGQFTNNLDINNDGVVDFKDWEIGGVKIANSYPMTWGDFGFAYLTYNALCRTMAQNGVWNQCANVIEAKENTNPQLTYKITLTHDKRYNIRVMAGVSPQPGASEPEHILGFPILNYQGGPYFMQGDTTEEDKTLEFGLDVTPLLDFVESGTEATFFLLVDEDDPGNSSTGLVNNWSVMDYTNGLNEIPFNQTNVPLVENGLTMLSLGATICFTPPEVAYNSIPPATVNEPYKHQLTGTQGSEPYHWWLNQEYEYSYSTQDFPEITAEELFPNGTNTGYAEKEIGFDFPFYGNVFKTFYVHTDGYLMFEENEMPWIFVIDDLNVMKNLPCIAPYMAKILGADGGGMWYEGNAEKATFRWKAIENGTGNTVNFAVSLFPSGKMEFFYGNIAFAPWNRWYAGISNGDGYNLEVLDISNNLNLQPNLKATLEPEFDFTEIALTREGLFHGTPRKVYDQTPVGFYLQDANGLRNVKTLPFSTDKINKIVISGIEVEAGNDSIIEYGENVSLLIELKNLSDEIVDASLMKISLVDEFVILTDTTLDLTYFDPGETKTFPAAFAFKISNTIPDNYPLTLNTTILTPDESYHSHIYLEAFSPVLSVTGIKVTDDDDNYPEPGDEITLSVHIRNDGGARAYNVSATLSGSNPGVSIINYEAIVGSISGYQTEDAVFTFSIDSLAQSDYSIIFNVEVQADSGFTAHETLVIKVGNIMEDAETGDFSLVNWQFSGASPWLIDQENPYEGQFCMKSGMIDHNRFSEMNVTMDVISDGVIRFASKVSGQQSMDFLQFLVDGITTGLWSGEIDWAERVFPVKAGKRTFTWKYSKDHTIAGGSDCAWIDNILFPPCVEEKSAITAGADIDICKDGTAQTEAAVFLAEPFSWLTSGDGTFSSANSLTPVYTPGLQDFANGSACLTFQAISLAGDTLSDDVSVFIHDYPVVWAGNDTAVCANQPIIEVNGTAQNTISVFWLSSGDGSFDNPEASETFYFPGPDDIFRGLFTLTLIGFPISPCETGMNHSFLVTLLPVPEVSFDSIGNICNTAQPFKLTQGQPAGGVYSGAAVIEGWFYPSQAGIGSHVLNYTFINNAGCSDTASHAVNVTDCTGIDETKVGKIFITPNPGKDVFTIQGLLFKENTYRLSVNNIYGVEIISLEMDVMQGIPVQIDLSHQPPGIYGVMLSGRNEVFTGKVVVSR